MSQYSATSDLARLPPHWEVYYDNQYQRSYFVDTRTGISTWDDPRLTIMSQGRISPIADSVEASEMASPLSSDASYARMTVADDLSSLKEAELKSSQLATPAATENLPNYAQVIADEALARRLLDEEQAKMHAAQQQQQQQPSSKPNVFQNLFKKRKENAKEPSHAAGPSAYPAQQHQHMHQGPPPHQYYNPTMTSSHSKVMYPGAPQKGYYPGGYPGVGTPVGQKGYPGAAVVRPPPPPPGFEGPSDSRIRNKGPLLATAGLVGLAALAGVGI
ncbi:hypothetical protein HDV05_003305 [Chytridiales sp. JEL 0842]|nr:hypothetical protein HDV05_003305 [Chytridiales sp. JEL 0842]